MVKCLDEGEPDLGLCSVVRMGNPISVVILGSSLGGIALQKLEMEASRVEGTKVWDGIVVGS